MILVFMLPVISSSSQVIECAPGQHVTGIIALGSSSSNNDMVVSAQVNMAGLSPSSPPIHQQGSVTVSLPGQSQRSWSIKVKADDITGGYMTEFDTSNNNYIKINEKKLNTPMFVWIDENNKADLSKGETLLKSGKGSGTFIVHFEQAAVWGDAALPQGREYHMTIKFTLS